jgi:flagellar hook-associated protein 1 FlgK
MASGVLGVALAGLNAAQAGLQTTGHNLANINTPNYSRQTTIQETNPAAFSGGGFMGTGVNVTSVRRVYAEYLQAQAQTMQSRVASDAAYSEHISQLNNVVSDPDLNVSSAIDNFFAGVQNLSGNPSDTAARQALLSAGSTLAARFRSFDSHMEDMRTSVNDRIHLSVATVNNLSKQLAALNNAIVRASGTGQPPNDLLDHRDQLLTQLNREINVTTVAQKDGSTSVFMGNGQSIVIGGNTEKLVAVPGDLDSSNMSVGLATGGGVRPFRDDEIAGGTLGGVIGFRNQVLNPTQNSIGRIALALGAQFNAQHAMGQDRTGAPGGDFFTLPGAKVLGAGHNQGNGVMAASIVDYSQLTDSDYRVAWDGSNYVVTRLSDSSQSTYASLPQTLDGVAISLSSGVPAAGDAFLVQPTRQGAWGFAMAAIGVNEIAAAAPIRAASVTANSGNASITSGTVSALDPNLTQPVTITFTGPGTYSVNGTGTGNPAGVAYVPGATISFNGWSVAIEGAPKAGDVFTIGPNTAGTGDNRNALALASLAQTAQVEGGTYATAYAGVLSSVGSKAQEINAASQSNDAILTQARESISSVSGVNLDEEAANLLRYQQAYQAASKVISIADQMFQSILNVSH